MAPKRYLVSQPWVSPTCEHMWEGPEGPGHRLQMPQPNSGRGPSSLFRVSGEAGGLMKKPPGFASFL